MYQHDIGRPLGSMPGDGDLTGAATGAAAPARFRPAHTATLSTSASASARAKSLVDSQSL
jgi:hypothetical protein